MRPAAIARERRHTLHFLDEIRDFAPVFLDTEVDMTEVAAHRAAARREVRRYSVVAYVLRAAAGVLARHPEANAAMRGRIRPRVARYPSVTGKLALDGTLNGQRVVLSVMLPELERTDLDGIQDLIDAHRAADPSTDRAFSRVRVLQRIPWPLRPVLFRLGARSLRRRPGVFGTLSVTSLGHRPVDGFHSVGGTTVTLGAGRIQDRPVVREGAVVIAPVMRLSLAFDHRVIDGAEAADVLSEVKDALESAQA
jgi:pyruvate/2-oxoglutarate dehydrogenase complex dihydrolipoamide acyltransferase (E2) component